MGSHCDGFLFQHVFLLLIQEIFWRRTPSIDVPTDVKKAKLLVELTANDLRACIKWCIVGVAYCLHIVMALGCDWDEWVVYRCVATNTKKFKVKLKLKLNRTELYWPRATLVPFWVVTLVSTQTFHGSRVWIVNTRLFSDRQSVHTL